MALFLAVATAGPIPGNNVPAVGTLERRSFGAASAGGVFDDGNHDEYNGRRLVRRSTNNQEQNRAIQPAHLQGVPAGTRTTFGQESRGSPGHTRGISDTSEYSEGELIASYAKSGSESGSAPGSPVPAQEPRSGETTANDHIRALQRKREEEAARAGNTLHRSAATRRPDRPVLTPGNRESGMSQASVAANPPGSSPRSSILSTSSSSSVRSGGSGNLVTGLHPPPPPRQDQGSRGGTSENLNTRSSKN
ncbi:hypothetical protein EX30DRAFT_399316 [Ascodesmis nigricans]|uniref:Uncharacterized protein n=1 Tax=Ascodesmis nigricans TaxID=341454 RepID=A0A4S2MMI0_9PEZI|nr:hypothetical protein EX30DRAFT_399316 [Ascodesmis nigricans]